MSDEMVFQPTAAPDGALVPVSAVTVGASPYTFTAPTAGGVISRIGTVSLIEHGRQGVFTAIGLSAGMFELSKGDALRVTYVVAPTMTFIPR